jgi:GAF domain-containing protein
LETDRPTWQAEEKAFAETILEQAALALENTRLLEASQRRAAHERLVADISRKVRSSASLNTILSSTILELGRALNASYAQIHIQPEAEAVADSAEPPDQPARVDTGDL